MRKAAVIAAIGTLLTLTPGLAHARHWGPYHRPGYVHAHFYPPVPLIGLGIASAVVGTTAALVTSLIPRPVFVAPPPPARRYYYPRRDYYEEGYRRGYDQGRRDSGYHRD